MIAFVVLAFLAVTSTAIVWDLSIAQHLERSEFKQKPLLELVPVKVLFAWYIIALVSEVVIAGIAVEAIHRSTFVSVVIMLVGLSVLSLESLVQNEI